MVFVTGDIHGNPQKLNTACFPEQKEMTKNDTVIICGDFGLIWDTEESKNERYWLDWLEEKPFTTVFIDGNHENFDRLYKYPVKEWNGGKVHEIRPHVLHLIRGEVFTIEGKKFFAFGGASSHDISDGILEGPDWVNEAKKLKKQGKNLYRVKGISWWEQELPKEEELENGLKNLASNDYKVDFVLSHCAPTFVVAMLGLEGKDALTDYFQKLCYDKGLDYKKWFFGHYHSNKNILDKFVLLYEQIVRVL